MRAFALIATEEVTSVMVAGHERVFRAGGYWLAIFHAPEDFALTRLGETTQYPAAVFTLWSDDERAELGIVPLDEAETAFDPAIHDAGPLVFTVADGRVTETLTFTDKPAPDPAV